MTCKEYLRNGRQPKQTVWMSNTEPRREVKKENGSRDTKRMKNIHQAGIHSLASVFFGRPEGVAESTDWKGDEREGKGRGDEKESNKKKAFVTGRRGRGGGWTSADASVSSDGERQEKGNESKRKNVLMKKGGEGAVGVGWLAGDAKTDHRK